MPFHIIQRGNNRTACFFSEDDYALYLGDLQRLTKKYDIAVHAYVLMTNHVHLLMTPETASGCSQLMKMLGQRYVQHVNRVYRRSGTLWEGRFRSSIVDAESYLLACQRYIELNPVRAGMVTHPAEYPWSSYRANAQGAPDVLIQAHAIYNGLGNDSPSRQAAYRELFRGDLEMRLVNQIRDSANGGFVLGSERFAKQVSAALQRRVVRGQPGRPRVKDNNEAQAALS
jgi:putative transposase